MPTLPVRLANNARSRRAIILGGVCFVAFFLALLSSSSAPDAPQATFLTERERNFHDRENDYTLDQIDVQRISRNKVLRGAQQSVTKPIARAPPPDKNIFRYQNYLFSCFYRSAQPFYHGARKVPSLKWIVVMLTSLFEVTNAGRGTAAVMFVDAETRERLQARLRASSDPRHNLMLSTRFLRLVAMHNSSSMRAAEPSESPAGLAAADDVQDLYPAYFSTRWASRINNGANNWRFAAIRDFLVAMKAAHGRNDNEFRSKRIVIADATDVAFQKNPFDTDESPGCWPHLTSRTHARLNGDVGAANAATTVFTLEHHSKSFSNEKYNRRWMSCYGQQNAPLPSRELKGTWLARRSISCAGVTLGDADGILRYTRRQIKEISQPQLVDCAISTIGAALDQATHNFILHHANTFTGGVACVAPPFEPTTTASRQLRIQPSVLPCNVSRDADDSESAHFGFRAVAAVHDTDACVFHGNFGTLRLNDGVGYTGADRSGTLAVRAPSGKMFAIVHQYTSDRHPSVMKMMSKAFDPQGAD